MRVKTRIDQEKTLYEQSSKETLAYERAGDGARWRVSFESATASRSKAEVLSDVLADHERRATQKERSAQDLRRQIDELRAQLQRYGDALENDLAAGRERIASRVKEALGYEKTFTDSSALLLNHLKGRPEVSELLEEMRREEANFQLGASGHTRADQTGAFKAIPG